MSAATILGGFKPDDQKPAYRAFIALINRMPTILPVELAWDWMMEQLPESRIMEIATHQYPAELMQAYSIERIFEVLWNQPKPLPMSRVLVNGFAQSAINADTISGHTEYEKAGDLTIKRVFYKSPVNGGETTSYTCDSLYVSGGKLIILGIKDKDQNPILRPMVFSFGPIAIYPVLIWYQN